MGYGGYSHDAHEAITRNRAHIPAAQVFEQTGKGVHSALNPKGLGMRESRDSALHPNSIAIAVVVDVTGSMGDVPKTMATKTLPSLMQNLLDCKVEDPQLMFIAIDDARCNSRAPLQVGQFESEAQRMDQYLTNIDIVGGGGGNGSESYELAAYALAYHTDIDCFNKRGKKGYVFFSGDDANFPYVDANHVRSIIGDDIREDISTADVYRKLRERFHVFCLIPPGHSQQAVPQWKALIGDHVIPIVGEHNDLVDETCTVISSIVALTEGRVADLPALAERFTNDGMDRKRVQYLVQTLTPFAATLQADGVPQPKVEEPDLPTGGARAPRQTPRDRRQARESA